MNHNIVYEDGDILVVYKPSGLAVQTASIRQKDLVDELKIYLSQEAAKLAESKERCREPYLGVIHRLDQPVEGILVFAKTKKAAAKLSEQVQNGTMKKYYYALIHGVPKEEGVLEHYLYKDAKTNSAIIVPVKQNNAKRAVLSYQTANTINQISLVKILLHTGRYHQIRAQMSYMGWPIAGDRRYGNEGSSNDSKAISLCAYRLEFNHPITGKALLFEISPGNFDVSPFLPVKT